MSLSMKSRISVKRMAAAGLAVCAMLLSACGSSGSGTSPTSTPEAQDQVLSFVAADKSNWDKAVNIGEYAYTLAVNFCQDGTVELAATCTGRAQAEAQRGGPGGGFGGPGAESAEPTPTPAELTDAEKAAQNFTKSGSWEYETGYGYNVTIDGYATKTNYDKASARQIFYAEISNGSAVSGLIQFQGKDTKFRSEIAADYEDFEIRDAAYIFEAVDTGTNNNPNSTHLYLEKDGSANSLTYQGSSPTYSRGSWTENADKSLTVSIGGTAYDVDYCDVSGREGYRVTYNSSTMYASVSGAEISYTPQDFNGATVLTLQCAEGDYTIDLTEKGFAVVSKNGEAQSTGKYTQENGTYTITLSGTSYVSEGNSITVEFAKPRQMFGPPGASNDPDVCTFALNSAPENG